MRRVLHLAGAALVALSLFFNVFRFWVMEATPVRGDDFRYYYAFARAGLNHGWSRIYDLTLQCEPIPSLTESTDHCPTLDLPPVGWLAAPFTSLPFTTGYVVWMAMLALALAAVLALAWSRLPEPRPLYVAGTLAAFPVAYCLYLGQTSILAVLGVALAWRLIASGHLNWAGLALLLIGAKPHAVLLVPVALAVAGIWRPALICAAGGLVLAAISGLTLGQQGIAEYLQLLRMELSWPVNYAYTLQGLVGRNLLATGLQVAMALTALVTAWRLRRHLDAVIVAGILGSILFSSYLHFQDYVLLIFAAAVQLSLGPRVPATVVALGVLVAGSPLVAGTTYVPAALQVDAWLALEIGWLIWLASRPSELFERAQAARDRPHQIATAAAVQ